MFRAEPVSNKICVQKWRDRSFQIHQNKLKKITASVDNKPPKTYPHLKTNMKKIQKEAERYEEIQRDNHILLKKMGDIMQKDTLDNKNDSLKYFKSLNRDLRKRELMKTTAENLAMLKRIQEKQPNYNHLQWEQDRKRNEQYCKNICQYQYQSQ